MQRCILDTVICFAFSAKSKQGGCSLFMLSDWSEDQQKQGIKPNPIFVARTPQKKLRCDSPLLVLLDGCLEDASQYMLG